MWNASQIYNKVCSANAVNIYFPSDFIFLKVLINLGATVLVND